MGLLDEAESALTTARQIEPSLPDAHLLWGLLKKNQGDLVQARDCLKEAVRVERSAAALCVLGVVERDLGNIEGARRAFEESAELDPTQEEAYYGLALTFESHDPQKAFALLERATSIDSDFAAAHREAGYCLWRLGRYSEALDRLLVALKLNPGDAFSHEYLGQVLRRLGRQAESGAAFRRATELCPDEPLFWCDLAETQEAMGNLREARSSHARALALDMSGALPNLRVGLFLKRRGELRKARLHFLRVLRADPGERRAVEALRDITERSS